MIVRRSIENISTNSNFAPTLIHYYLLFNEILDINKYLMKGFCKIMFGTIKKMFIILLGSIVNASHHTKCVSLSNQKCKIQPTLINLHPTECNQELH